MRYGNSLWLDLPVKNIVTIQFKETILVILRSLGFELRRTCASKNLSNIFIRAFKSRNAFEVKRFLTLFLYKSHERRKWLVASLDIFVCFCFSLCFADYF